MTKSCMKLPFMPLFWGVKKFYPNIIDDLSTSRKKLKT